MNIFSGGGRGDNMTLDQTVIACGTSAFAVFVLSHIVFFRCLPADKVIHAVQKAFFCGILVLMVIISLLPQWGLADKCLVFIFSSGVHSLMSFAYVLCIFGPYATSIRMRLIKELDTPDGKTLAGIERTYNDRTILDARLKRLLAAGDVRLNGDQYAVSDGHNAFFIIDLIARKLHAFTRPR